jgi:hypothetical protein
MAGLSTDDFYPITTDEAATIASMRREAEMLASDDCDVVLGAFKSMKERHDAEWPSSDVITTNLLRSYDRHKNGQKVADMSGFTRAYVNKLKRDRERAA